MPRTGGVYAPPSGTYGTPNTTIQSAKYNALVDDLTADANAPRPVTAGGTGATNATDARTNIGANNADNLTAGTVNDARLPTTMAGKTFTGITTVNSSSGAATAQTRFDGASIELFWETGAYIDFKNASGDDYDVRIQQDGANRLNITATTGLFVNGNAVWNAGNDGAGSGLDADVLDGMAPTTARTANTIVQRGASAEFTAGDITTHRGNTTGVIYLGDQSGGSRYLHYDGTSYTMPGASLTVGSNIHAGGNVYSGSALFVTDGNINGTLWGGWLSTYLANQFANKISVGGRAYPLKAGGTNINWNWAGQSGQPPWLWGGSDGVEMYVYNPSNFSVNYANSAGSITGQGNLATMNNTSLVYSGTDVSNTSFPITSRLFVYTNGTAYARNATVPVYLYTLSNQAFANTGTTAVSGTWRNRGQMASDWVLAERVA